MFVRFNLSNRKVTIGSPLVVKNLFELFRLELIEDDAFKVMGAGESVTLIMKASGDEDGDTIGGVQVGPDEYVADELEYQKNFSTNTVGIAALLPNGTSSVVLTCSLVYEEPGGSDITSQTFSVVVQNSPYQGTTDLPGVAYSTRNPGYWTSLTGGSATALDGILTANGAFPVGNCVVTLIGGTAKIWQLKSGTTAENGTTIIRPDDYHATTNQRYWELLTLVSNAAWGTISGTLSAQTDLQAALDLKATAANLSSHTANVSNPHSVTKSQVGLGNCDNTSDVNKPVSTAQAAADSVIAGNLSSHTANTSNPHSVTASQVGLGNCDNTSDANKPVSTATQTALDLKANLSLSIVDYNTIDHTLVLSDAGKLVRLSYGSACTLTIPLNASVAFPIGTQILVKQQGAGTITVASVGGGGVTIVSRGSLVDTNGQYAVVVLVKEDTNTWLLSGDRA